MCSCNTQPESPIDGSGDALSFSSPSTPRCGLSPSTPTVEVESTKTPIVAPVENEVPIPVPTPVPTPSPRPRRSVVESSTTLHVVTEEEVQEIEDRLVGAWQRQGRGADNAIPTTLVGSESNKTSSPSCAMPVMQLTWEQMQTQSLGARGYRMLSMMRAVTMIPNSTVSARLLSSDHVGGELQLVFPISQEEFNSLLSGELEAEVHPVMMQEVVRGGVEDIEEELEYSDSTPYSISCASKGINLTLSPLQVTKAPIPQAVLDGWFSLSPAPTVPAIYTTPPLTATTGNKCSQADSISISSDSPESLHGGSNYTHADTATAGNEGTDTNDIKIIEKPPKKQICVLSPKARDPPTFIQGSSKDRDLNGLAQQLQQSASFEESHHNVWPNDKGANLWNF
ncbi:hypothetical protein BDM02DRAFT_3193447 [Thelephora ganbajun]|uniref:Uncharacterized protein n=1 Tax=Thelephora ganbajun TaxID=370292 RepID=A0ACB6YZN2_THEGA|nr:hypothetical protein BDM02DRAFT_3193447 [Thelephora ganbajun]